LFGGKVVNNPHPKDLSKNPAVAGFFVSPHLFLYSTVTIRLILVVTLLLITNFIVWSWALEKHPEPEIQPVSMDLIDEKQN